MEGDVPAESSTVSQLNHHIISPRLGAVAALPRADSAQAGQPRREVKATGCVMRWRSQAAGAFNR